MPFTKRRDGLNVALRLTPRAKKNAIFGTAKDENGNLYLKASVTAPAQEGRANKELIKLLAKIWHLPKSSLSIVVGQTARHKVIHIAGNPDTLTRVFTEFFTESSAESSKNWMKKEKEKEK